MSYQKKSLTCITIFGIKLKKKKKTQKTPTKAKKQRETRRVFCPDFDLTAVHKCFWLKRERLALNHSQANYALELSSDLVIDLLPYSMTKLEILKLNARLA